MKKKLILIFFILGLTQCGFNPIYKDTNEAKIKITITDIKGDKFINNIMKNELERISSRDPSKELKVSINTSFNKIVISRDAKGSASNYQIEVIANFTIKDADNTKEITFSEKQNFENISDIFEQKNYEETIKENFTISIVRKFNLKLLNNL